MLKGPEHLLCKERLRDLCLVSLERRLRGDLIDVNKSLKCGRQLDAARFFLVVCSDKTRSNGLKLEHKMFHTSIWKKLLTVRVREH